MDLVVSPGVRLWVEERGNGVPVVLLHGHSLDLRVFQEVAEDLERAGFKVVTYDQRGHGRSSSPPQGYRWGDHAGDLQAVVEKLGLAPIHGVGLSKGGGIVLEAAVRFPSLFRSLVLISPLIPDYPLSPEFYGFFKTFARAIRQQGVQAAARELWLKHPLLLSAWEKPHLRSQLETMVFEFPAGEYLAQERDAPDRNWRLVERLGELQLPVLVVRGEHDTQEFCQMADFLIGAIPKSTLSVIPASGHLVPLEQPHQLSQLLLAFYAKLGR
ncbi:MAG: alpha/beta fold hydrolase [Thermoanaerobaculaceae bacterium]